MCSIDFNKQYKKYSPVYSWKIIWSNKFVAGDPQSEPNLNKLENLEEAKQHLRATRSHIESQEAEEHIPEHFTEIVLKYKIMSFV